MGEIRLNQIGDYSGIISVGIDDPNIIRVMDVLYPYDWNDDAGTWETNDGGLTWAHTGLIENWNQGYTQNQYYAYSSSFNGLNKTVTKDIFNSDRFYASFGQWAWASFDGGMTLNNISTQEVEANHWISKGVENLNGHCLEINESNPNVVYIGTWDVGFWVSQDNGDSWTRFQPNYNLYPEYSWDLGEVPVAESEAIHGAGANITTLLNDPDRENVVWATFSRGQFTDPAENAVAKTGLFKSTNYGQDWVLITEGLPVFDNMIRTFGLALKKRSPIENRTLFFTVDGHVYRSIDDGMSWEMILNNGFLKFVEVDKFEGTNVFAGGKDGLWRSEDGGDTWDDIGIPEVHSFHANTRPDIVPTWIDWSFDPPLYPFEGIFDIQTDPNVPGRLYITVYGPDKGLYRSDDYGDTWLNILVDSEMRGMAISPANSDVIYVTSSKAYHSGGFGNSTGILYSTDAGLTWSEANDNMAYNYAGMIEVETGDNPNVWVWSPGTGVQKSEVPFFGTDRIEENIEQDFSIFPNPADDKISIDVSTFNFDIERVDIVSSSGELVFSMKVLTNPKTLEINVSNLASGKYIVKVINRDKIIRSSFIKK